MVRAVRLRLCYILYEMYAASYKARQGRYGWYDGLMDGYGK